MNDWDDLRYFLAVAGNGSIRGAAAVLGVNHSTVSRRIDGFEKRIGTRLFVRMPTGYFLTQAGEEMRTSAQNVAAEIDSIDRRVVGRDARLSGLLRVAVHDTLAQKLLMPGFVAFNAAFPDIELELKISSSMANLTKREADVAIRITNDPAENLVGRRILKYATAGYASLDYLACHDLENDDSGVTWVGWNDTVARPQWVRDSAYPKFEARNRIFHPMTQLEAAKAGMGLCMLPCFLGDSEPALRRIPPAIAVPDRDIWILTHEDLRQTARVRQFSDFMAGEILAKKDLLEGRCPR